MRISTPSTCHSTQTSWTEDCTLSELVCLSSCFCEQSFSSPWGDSSLAYLWATHSPGSATSSSRRTLQPLSPTQFTVWWVISGWCTRPSLGRGSFDSLYLDFIRFCPIYKRPLARETFHFWTSFESFKTYCFEDSESNWLKQCDWVFETNVYVYKRLNQMKKQKLSKLWKSHWLMTQIK